MTNIFALRDSSLNAFLFSDVGVEANGTELTILSLLARLGKDPWTEAAAWARKPKDAAIRLLTDSISQMPPNQQALDDAHLTATRLVDLLPAPAAEIVRVSGSLPSTLAVVPKSAALVLVYAVLFIVFISWLAAAPKPEAITPFAANPVTTPTK